MEESNFVYTVYFKVVYTPSVYWHCINLYTYCSYQLHKISSSQHLVTTTLLNFFQIFSTNLSKSITRGGIKWSLGRSNSQGTSHSTKGQDDSSSSTAGLYCTVLHSTIYRCAVCLHIVINISIRYGSEWVTFCCSYVYCHKMVTDGRILVFEVSIEPY